MDNEKTKKQFISKKSYLPGYISKEQIKKLCYMQFCGELECTKHYLTDRKDYDSFLLYYVVCGKSFLKFQGTDQVLHAGQAFLIDCDPHQVYGAYKDNSCNIIYAHFKGGCTRYYYDKIVENKGYVLSGMDAEIIASGIRRLMEQTTASPKYRVETLSNTVRQILSDLLTLNIKENSPYEIAAQYARRCIYENKSLNVSDMAKSVGYSKYHFTNQFTAYFGVPPYEFIIKERIELCKSKLINSNAQISTIALDLGFVDTAHLTNCFKKREGVTPSVYRRKWRV
ncbi:MAG: helix-turn-helix domain-containing protein [Clostridiales bacterium]|nr:helix-turn-helix domain-containing protein [Clostridiales bacterium]